ncbi:16S rRNA (cytosine(967)-C(5))-methyltransferase RsmB [Pseudoxanthomonas sacheonensis]|uniref:16S rRNA (cytosine(967)-C(5))-methyltransferase n=1 Tax=Pseudoxanthomonas sacheonensis TaxID=443615 RepID=A0ABU1RTH5_9GAMM|nr:16S rRNA (cytosine(967)-C(5))-methyltransferase RsmB [Pseudoxanthomonas sacheonensis]MDR6842081.1 16S rRNA (cytosine967-C5)-methyltransferase [Pseudoxanthomonas sacheonensis]
MNAGPGVATRVLAAKVLEAVIHRGRSLKGELVTALAQLPDPRDRALLEAICFSALRQRARYDAALQLWLQKPLGEKDGDLRSLLLVGFAQIDAMGLPAHAALSATVEAARTLGRPHQAGMVNALLRRAQREGFPESDPAAAWSAWLRKKINLEWGEHANAIFQASAHAAPLWLRVNRSKGTRDEYASRLQEADIVSSIDPNLSDALRIDLPVAVSALPGFAEGDASVQDGSAQQVADALPLGPGAHVLDACAAPGGKAAHLLERDPSLRLLALDVDQRRLNRVRETLTRIGAQAEFRVADASDTQTWWNGEPFDAVLLDAPCSATGIVRRQPDVLLHRRPEDLSSLVALQARLLDGVWKTVKSGGVLLYATCSILKDENEHQLSRFVARTADAQPEALDARYGHAAGHGRQRLPGEQGMDGFFYALLRKRNSH